MKANVECGVRSAEWQHSRMRHRASASYRAAFTLLEIMVAIGIFMLILTAIYSIWHGIIKGTRSGIKAVQEVQRSRVTMHSIEQALLCARVFTDNITNYYFYGQPNSVEMTCRLPADFLGMGFVDPNLRMRRVGFYTEASKLGGGDDLIMWHSPMLIDTNAPGGEPYSIVLARDVTRFDLEYVDFRKDEWITDWTYTNTMPKLIRITVGLGKSGSGSFGQDLVSRIIAMPAQPIGGLQGGLPNQPIPGMVPPGGRGGNPGGGRVINQ